MKITKFLLCAVMMFSLIGGSVSAQEGKNEVAFSIPANSFCDASHKVQLSLNITNIGGNAADITLQLYNEEGAPISIKGDSYNGIKSNITLGASTNIAPKKTVFYQVSLGQNYFSCEEMPYYGTLQVKDSSSKVIASGWISATNGNTPIIINSGLPITGSHNEGNEGEETTPPSDTNLVKPLDCKDPEKAILAFASSSYSQNFLPCKAFDGDIYTSWATKDYTTAGWLGVDFGEPTLVQKYEIAARTKSIDGTGSAPNTWTFEGSNDKINWTELDTQVDQKSWEFGETRSFLTKNKNSYRYYRINITKNNGLELYTAIGELRMF